MSTNSPGNLSDILSRATRDAPRPQQAPPPQVPQQQILTQQAGQPHTLFHQVPQQLFQQAPQQQIRQPQVFFPPIFQQHMPQQIFPENEINDLFVNALQFAGRYAEIEFEEKVDDILSAISSWRFYSDNPFGQAIEILLNGQSVFILRLIASFILHDIPVFDVLPHYLLNNSFDVMYRFIVQTVITIKRFATSLDFDPQGGLLNVPGFIEIIKTVKVDQYPTLHNIKEKNSSRFDDNFNGISDICIELHFDLPVDRHFQINIIFLTNIGKNQPALGKLIASSATDAICQCYNNLSLDEKLQWKSSLIRITLLLQSSLDNKVCVQQQSMWLHKESIFCQNIFILLKINPKAIDFSISSFNTKAPFLKEEKDKSFNTKVDYDTNFIIKRQELFSKYFTQVIMHEMGHNFQAALHPLDFRIRNSMTKNDEIHVPPDTLKVLVRLFGTPAVYSSRNRLETIAELFLFYNLSVDEQLGLLEHGRRPSPELNTPDAIIEDLRTIYAWYCAEGGPQIAPHITAILEDQIRSLFPSVDN